MRAAGGADRGLGHLGMLDNGPPVPFYEYRRPDGTILEVMQKMTDPPLTEDPESGVPVTRVFHPIAVHFKGKGFYNTDYGTKNRAREQESKQAAEKKSEQSSSGEKKSDASSAGEGSTAAPKSETTKSETKSSPSGSDSSSSKSTKKT
jgi:predicted nucleic acid-binding Zn ribbon protein